MHTPGGGCVHLRVEIRKLYLQTKGCHRLPASHQILVETCVIKFSFMSQGGGSTKEGTSCVSPRT